MQLKTFLRFARIKYLWCNKMGFCPVCGRNSIFVLTQEIQRIRNDGICIGCGSCSRTRHVAKCILDEFKDRKITSLKDFKTRPDISVFNASSGGSIARKMGTAKNIFMSEYFDDCKPGEFKNGIQCQDVEQLTFPDSSMDLIITEDVFEHVKNRRKGFTEVYRILKKNGVHIFSIPFYFDKKTEELFTLKNGKYELKEPIEYHGDPIQGTIPAYTRLGYDLFDFLRSINFEVKIDISEYADSIKFATYNSYTFITKKC
jgi:Methyltransferase domain.